jgi:hypothetical protein
MPKYVTGLSNSHISWNKTARYNVITTIKRAWARLGLEERLVLSVDDPWLRNRGGITSRFQFGEGLQTTAVKILD